MKQRAGDNRIFLHSVHKHRKFPTACATVTDRPLVQPRVSLNGAITILDLGQPLSVPAGWFNPDDNQGLAVGIISTSKNSGGTFVATWDFLDINYLPSDGEAYIAVTSGGGINASTYISGSFEIANSSANGKEIVAAAIDLSSSLLPDMVFDSDGVAGDLTAKCLTADSGAAATGFVAPSNPCIDPFSVPHDNGYDVLTLAYNDFQTGETFSFSLDVDPTSIQGVLAPGFGESGSVSGLKLTGSTVHIEFNDGTIQTSTLYRQPDSDSGSQSKIRQNLPAAPAISVVGLTPHHQRTRCRILHLSIHQRLSPGCTMSR